MDDLTFPNGRSRVSERMTSLPGENVPPGVRSPLLSPPDTPTDPSTELDMLRHALATLSYRGGKVLRGAPDGFGSFSAGPGSRTALEILSHVGDLFDWAIHMADGKHVWAEEAVEGWEGAVGRFFSGLAALDDRFASGEPLGLPGRKLFQGPFADAFTHVGQLAMLRRLAGSPVRGDNYFKADIQAGRVGPDQPPPGYEFD